MTPEASHGVSGGIVGINECNSQIRLRSKRDPRSTVRSRHVLFSVVIVKIPSYYTKYYLHYQWLCHVGRSKRCCVRFHHSSHDGCFARAVPKVLLHRRSIRTRIRGQCSDSSSHSIYSHSAEHRGRNQSDIRTRSLLLLPQANLRAFLASPQQQP